MHPDHAQLCGLVTQATELASTTPWLDAHPLVKQLLTVGLQYLLNLLLHLPTPGPTPAPKLADTPPTA